MLVVTAASRCRYCAYSHSRLASRAGVERAEVEQLLEGELRSAPPRELPALVYAQHWAENDGRSDPEARRCLEATYGPGTAGTIDVLLRAIRIGNLSGNSWDELLCVLSRGRVGCDDSRGGRRAVTGEL